jgi:hypothetical protein
MASNQAPVNAAPTDAAQQVRLLAGGVTCALVSAAVVAWLPSGGTPVLIGGIAAFAVVAWLVLRRSTGQGLSLVIACAALCQVPGLLAAPISSTDAYRYVWDGRVSLSGSSAYGKVPLDDDLAGLRDPVLFPGLSPSDRSGVSGPPHLPRAAEDLAGYAADDPRTRINRPRVPTIYPPIAQIYFAVVAAVTPWSAGTLGLQIASALLAVALTALIGMHLRRTGRDARSALLWGWCPVVVVEAANSAHVDVLAALLVTAAVISRRGLVAGVLLGLAAGVKLVPLLLLPAFARLHPTSSALARGRRGFGGRPGAGWLTVAGTAVGVVVLAYLPHVVVVGKAVLGFLPGYVTAEGFADGGSRYAVIGLLMPPPVRAPVAVVIAVVVAVLVLRHRGDVAVKCCWLFGSALLVATPTYPWYCLLLIPLAILAGRLEWLTVPLAAYVAYANLDHPHVAGIAYLAATVVVLYRPMRSRVVADKAEVAVGSG